MKASATGLRCGSRNYTQTDRTVVETAIRPYGGVWSGSHPGRRRNLRLYRQSRRRLRGSEDRLVRVAAGRHNAEHGLTQDAI
jgi:hypothetical protein